MTRQADWYFDFVSPFSYLQWPQLQALSGRLQLTCRPLLFAAVLDHYGSIDPAELPEKRRFLYRFVLWQAQQLGRPLRFPPAHPFNPMLALRLCIAAGTTPQAIGAIFDWIWAEGRAVDTPEAIAPLAARLGVTDPAALSAEAVKRQLRDNYERALAQRVFGVPSFVADGEVFWGNDATEMFKAWLDDRSRFETPEMQRVQELPIAAQRAAVAARERSGP